MPDARPLVSILMNCYNGDRYLSEAIDSVISQTYQNWELIFWDNLSTDDSAKICRSYGDSRVKYFRSAHHTNLGAARALALQQAKGELIAVLDTDDLWLPRKLELQVPVFTSADVGIVISDTIFFNDGGKEKQLYKSHPPPQGRVFYELVTRYFVSLETVVLRKSAIDSLDHSFDPDLNHISDFDLIVRLGRSWKLSYVPEVLAKWRVHGASGTWKEGEGFNMERLQFGKKMDLMYASSDSDWQGVKRAFMCNIAVSRAAASLLRGDREECRGHLFGFVLDSWKTALLYFLSFLPFSGGIVRAYRRRGILPVPGGPSTLQK